MSINLDSFRANRPFRLAGNKFSSCIKLSKSGGFSLPVKKPETCVLEFEVLSNSPLLEVSKDFEMGFN